MSEMNWFTNHAAMMSIDGADEVFKSLFSDPHFKNTVLKRGKNALSIKFELQLQGDYRVCEPSSQDMEAMMRAAAIRRFVVSFSQAL